MRFSHHLPLRLESGITVPVYHLEYTTQGSLNEAGDNVVWIFHALTANSDAGEWWGCGKYISALGGVWGGSSCWNGLSRSRSCSVILSLLPPTGGILPGGS